MGFGRRGRAIDQLQIGRHLLALFPGLVIQRGPHQMHNAQLHFGPGIDRSDGFGEPNSQGARLVEQPPTMVDIFSTLVEAFRARQTCGMLAIFK
jgi:hypothetical protein